MKKSLVSLLAVFSMLSVFSADLILESGNYRVVFSDKPELYVLRISGIRTRNSEPVPGFTAISLRLKTESTSVRGILKAE